MGMGQKLNKQWEMGMGMVINQNDGNPFPWE